MLEQKQNKLVVDRDKRTIEGVSILSAGMTLNGFAVDAKTLTQGFGLLQKKSSPVYIDHESELKPHTPENIIGVVGAAFIDNGVLRGTLTFLKSFVESNKDEYERLMELAETNPEIFGLSIFYEGSYVTVDADTNEETPAEKEDLPEERFLRLSQLFSVDFVAIPAANPQGLSKNNLSLNMNPEEIQKLMADSDAKFTAQLQALEARIVALEAKSEAAPVEEAAKQESEEVKTLKAKLTETENALKIAKAGVTVDLGAPVTDTLSIKDQYKALQKKGDFKAALSFYRKHKADLKV
jgi:hypothetical protein